MAQDEHLIWKFFNPRVLGFFVFTSLLTGVSIIGFLGPDSLLEPPTPDDTLIFSGNISLVLLLTFCLCNVGSFVFETANPSQSLESRYLKRKGISLIALGWLFWTGSVVVTGFLSQIMIGAERAQGDHFMGFQLRDFFEGLDWIFIYGLVHMLLPVFWFFVLSMRFQVKRRVFRAADHTRIINDLD